VPYAEPEWGTFSMAFSIFGITIYRYVKQQ
jgi:hypothetical protein